MKKVYVVRGSEDGNLGVYSNAKLAYNRVVQYLSREESKLAIYFLSADKMTSERRAGSYQNACKKLSRFNAVDIEGNSATASIELFALNA